MGAKTVLITGASRGIGRAAAELFAERGYRVLLNYRRSKAAAEELERELAARGADLRGFATDLHLPFGTPAEYAQAEQEANKAAFEMLM